MLAQGGATSTPAMTSGSAAERALTAVIVLGGFMAGLDTSLVNVGLTTVARDLNASLSAAQWMTSGYLLALGAALPAGPWLQRRLGPSRLWLISLLTFTAASLACALAPNLAVLLIARVAQGLAGGLLVPTGQSILARAVGAQRMSRVMSTAGIAVVLAPAIGPALGGLLIDALNWRWLFVVNLPIGAVAALLAVRILPRQEPDPDAKLDAAGLALLSTALPALLLGLTWFGASAGQRTWGIALLLTGMALLAAFVGYSARRRGRTTLLDLGLFRQPRYTAAQITVLFAGLGQYGGLILLPLYYEALRGLSVVHTGVLLLAYGAGAMAGLQLGGRLTDRVGSGLTCLTGLALTIAATAPFVAFDAHTSLPAVEVLQALRGIGVGLSGIPAMTAAIRSAPSAITDATITSNILQRVGGSFGSALIVLVVADLSPRLHAVQVAHAVLIGTAAVALLASIALAVTERRPMASAETPADTAPAPHPASPGPETKEPDMTNGSVTRDNDMTIEWDVPVTTSAGTVVRADVFRPAAPGRYPVIMNHGVYGKGLAIDRFRSGMVAHLASHPLLGNAGGADLADTTDENATPDVAPGDYRVWEAVDPSVWVKAGYACVRVDSRGSGTSAGYLDPLSPGEIGDFADCIEWAGTREWSSGRVGLAGKSYYAMTQWLVAARKPEHLAAICVWHGLSDWYRDATRHGGIVYQFWETFWYPTLVLPVQNGQGDETNPHSGHPITGAAKLDPETLAANRTDIVTDIRNHPTVDEYHRARTPDLSQVDVPVLASADWSDHDLHLRGTIRGWAGAGSADKWLEIHNGGQFDDPESVRLQMRFFDYALKDKAGPWTEQPRVQLAIREVDGSATRYDAESWPVPGTTWTPWYADLAAGTLAEQPPAEPASIAYDATGDGVVLLGPAIARDTTVIGPVSAQLYLSSSTTDADLFLTLDAVDPDGNLVELRDHRAGLTPLSVGWQRASQRAANPAASTAGTPVHAHAKAEPLLPGAITPVQIELVPTSLHLPAGYRLKLAVRGHDAGHDDPVDRPSEVFRNRVTLYSDAEHPSHLLLPTAQLADIDKLEQSL